MESVPETCQPYDEDLSALLDGELSSARAGELRSHTERCPRCAAQLAALRRANEWVVSALHAPAEAEDARIARLEARLRARLADDARLAGARLRPSPAAPRRPSRGRWVAAAGFGLAAAAALGLALLYQARAPVAPAPVSPPPIAQTRPPAPPPAPQEEPPKATPAPESVAELPVVKPAPARPLRPVAPTPQPEQGTRPLPSSSPELDLASADEEDIELASRLDMLEDFEVIQKLELLERLRKAEEGAGSG